jgi:hypothetical protein
MAEYVSIDELERRARKLRQKFEEAFGEEFRWYEVTMDLIRAKRTAGSKYLAHYKGDHIGAVKAVLTENGTWMTKEDVLAALLDGGHLDGSKTMYWTANSAINNNAKGEKHWRLRFPEREMKTLVGLKGWPEPTE